MNYTTFSLLDRTNNMIDWCSKISKESYNY